MIYVLSKLNVLFEYSPVTRIINVETGVWKCMQIIFLATVSAKLTLRLIQNTKFEIIIQKMYFKNRMS